MLRRIVIFLAGPLLCALLAPAPARADFASGLAAYDTGDYAAAARAWEGAARAGDVAAMRNLGHLYRWGRGVARDMETAAAWYERAATLGFDRAQVNLAALYLSGDGVVQSRATAIAWLTKAAAQGNATAQTMLDDLTGTPATAASSRAGHAAAQDRPETAPRSAAKPVTKPATRQTAPNTASNTARGTPQDRPPAPAAARMHPAHTPETGILAHLGVYDSRAAAEQGWADLRTQVPALQSLRPVYMPGYLPGQGDIVRLYADGPRGKLIPLCAQVVAAVPGTPCELHRFWR